MQEYNSRIFFFLKKRGNENRFSLSDSMEREREREFCRPLETEFSRRVAPLRKRNGRIWANEIHVQVPKHSWQFPRVIGSWLRGVFHLPTTKVTCRACPSSSLLQDALWEVAGPSSFGTLRRDFYERFYRNVFIILSHPKHYLSRRDFLDMRQVFVLDWTAPVRSTIDRDNLVSLKKFSLL